MKYPIIILFLVMLVMRQSEGRRDVAADVKRIIAEQLGVDQAEVKPDSRIVEDLGADDLAQVELIMALEEEFDLLIPDADTDKIIATVNDAIEYIKRRYRE